MAKLLFGKQPTFIVSQDECSVTCVSFTAFDNLKRQTKYQHQKADLTLSPHELSVIAS